MTEPAKTYVVKQVRTTYRTLVVEAKANGVVGAAMRNEFDNADGWIDDEPEKWRLFTVTEAPQGQLPAHIYE